MGRDDDLRHLSPELRKLRTRSRDQVDSARARFRAEELIGVTVQEARLVVEEAGGEFSTDAGPISTKLDFNRLIAHVVDGRVTGYSIG